MRSVRVAALVLPLVGCAALRPPPPIQVFDKRPLSEVGASAPVRLSADGPGSDEDPAVTVDRDGRFVVVWSARRGRQVDLVMRTSTDGSNWSATRAITDDADEDYYPSITQTRDGTYHLAWFRLRRASGEIDIWYSRSPDGTMWSPPVQISRDRKDWAPSIFEDPKGALWIAWSSGRSGTRQLLAVRSTDGGQQWSSPAALTSGPAENDFPQVVVRPSGERVLVWTRYQAGSARGDYYRDASAEVVMATSADGISWSAPMVCSPEDPDERYVDFIPFAFQDRTGKQLYVSWTSGRSGPRGDILVREEPGNATQIRQLTDSDEPDYSGKIVATSRPGEFLLVWTGTRGGRTDIYVRRFAL